MFRRWKTKTEEQEKRKGGIIAVSMMELRLWAKEEIAKSLDNRKMQFEYTSCKWQTENPTVSLKP